nr:MAG TPA: hypothetical protein [Caudoviricetes sp.]
MKNFNEEIKAYALLNGFEEIAESEITKPEFREKAISDPFYLTLYRKKIYGKTEIGDYNVWILVHKKVSPDNFSIRICLRYPELTHEYQMRISEFLKFGSLALDMFIENSYLRTIDPQNRFN